MLMGEEGLTLYVRVYQIIGEDGKPIYMPHYFINPADIPVIDARTAQQGFTVAYEKQRPIGGVEDMSSFAAQITPSVTKDWGKELDTASLDKILE